MTSSDDGSAETDGGTGSDGRVNFSVTVEDGETHITMRGDRDTAVIVRSESGERIYLPPEDFERGTSGRGDSHDEGVESDSPYQPAPDDSPYGGTRNSPYRGVQNESPYQGAESDSPYRGVESDSPYQGAESDSPYQGAESDSPYQAAGESLPSEGMVPTADGYRIRHPEPVTDVRVLR